jgi:hypothetical protein
VLAFLVSFKEKSVVVATIPSASPKRDRAVAGARKLVERIRALFGDEQRPTETHVGPTGESEKRD